MAWCCIGLGLALIAICALSLALKTILDERDDLLRENADLRALIQLNKK